MDSESPSTPSGHLPPPGLLDVERVTTTLRAAENGDRKAAEALLPLVYAELRKLGRWMMQRRPGDTLRPTSLVHEAYIRLVGAEDPGWNGRGHFFGAAANAMRRILVDQARRKNRKKHGGGLRRLDADEVDLLLESPAEDVLALNESIDALRAYDQRKADVVMLRYFSGLTAQETAAALGVSVPTVERDWRFARAFLFDRLRS